MIRSAITVHPEKFSQPAFHKSFLAKSGSFGSKPGRVRAFSRMRKHPEGHALGRASEIQLRPGWPSGCLLCFALLFMIFILFSNDWVHVAHGAQMVSLSELEAKVNAAPQVLVAAAELDRQGNLLEREQAVTGWKVFGSVSNGTFQESTDVNVTRQYNQAAAKMGLRFPLLGTRMREQLNILHAESKALESRHKVDLATRISLTELRSQYVNYWDNLRRIELSEGFLEGRERVERWLAARTSQGFLLDADRQEFITAFELAVRNIANAQTIIKRAMGVMNLLTGSDLGEFVPIRPILPPPCTDENRLKSRLIDSSPELLIRRGLVDEQRNALKLGRKGEIDGSLDLAGSGSLDYPDVEPGYGLALSLNVQFPAGIRKAGEARQRASLAALRKAQLELDQKTGELLLDAVSSLGEYHAAHANLRFAHQRAKAAQESLREARLRAGSLPGDTLEKLQQSRFQNYQTGLDSVDAEARMLQAHAALLQFDPEGCGEPSMTPRLQTQNDWALSKNSAQSNGRSESYPHLTTQGAKSAEGRAFTQSSGSGMSSQLRPTAVYLWKSQPWLDGSITCDAGRQALDSLGIGKVLISLNKQQIEAALLPEGAKRLRDFLNCARIHGLSVELLLGEPTWILPAFRKDLLRIIDELKNFPFDGLHLDLEPDQLNTKEYSREYLLEQLIQTLQAVVQVSPWPVGFSVHPRYFDTHHFRVRLAPALEAARVSEVVLMIYASDAEKVAKRAAPILKAHPGLRFSVAVSVEADLSPSESFATQGRSRLDEALDTLRSRLRRSNFLGIMIQSWTDLENMEP